MHIVRVIESSSSTFGKNNAYSMVSDQKLKDFNLAKKQQQRQVHLKGSIMAKFQLRSTFQ